MTIITVSRAATADEVAAEMDRRGAAIERLETNLRHWREECGKLHSQLDRVTNELRLANTGGLSLLYDIRRELGWNDKTSLSILADGVRRVRRALQTWNSPTNMDLEALALAVKARVVELEKSNVDNKNRIQELLEELASPDPRGPDHSRIGMFVLHNCARCDSGKMPCVSGNPSQCEYPHARNE